MRTARRLPPLGSADAALLADLHALSADPHWDRPWSAAEIADLMKDPAGGTAAAICADADNTVLGFALWRTIIGEAELLFIGTTPNARRRGVGQALLRECLDHAQTAGTEKVFLEVRVSNLAARALYTSHGFEICGQRKDYFCSIMGQKEDALVLCCTLPRL